MFWGMTEEGTVSMKNGIKWMTKRDSKSKYKEGGWTREYL